MAYWDHSYDVGYRDAAKQQRETLMSKWAPRRSLYFIGIVCVMSWALLGWLTTFI